MTQSKSAHSPTAILICAAAILAISLGVRHSFGLFLQPFSMAGGWLGGVLYDRLGSYDGAWGLAIGLSLMAALLSIMLALAFCQ